MLKIILFSLGSLWMLSTIEIPDKVLKKAEKEIEKFFETSQYSKEYITISAADELNTTADFSSENLFKIISNNVLLGYAYIGNAPSKTATFDYLVLFDPQWIITKTKVLIYREEYGGEIGSKRWLEQFEGGSGESFPFKYVEDIIPISGATISAQSMTRAVNDLLESIKYLKLKDRI